MTFLVDANVLSEPTRQHPDVGVVQWLRDHEREIWIDPIVLGEVRFGILLLPEGTRRRRLERWFSRGIRKIRCLDWDAAVGIRWASLLAELRSQGTSMPIKDSLIAASALHHGLTVATRNTPDFQYASVPTTNPFASR